MSNIVDDLLHDVEELEASTQDMDSNVQGLEQQKSTLNDRVKATHDKTLLETAKISQESAKQSHSAAAASIKLSEQLKARNTELEELSNNWRQAVRNTLREQQTAKKYFAVMLGATLAISIISLSSIGYFFYLLNQQNTQHKGEMLDIIQTESKLLSNKLTVKTDELASLTEAMSADVKRLSNQNIQSSTNTSSAKDIKQATVDSSDTQKITNTELSKQAATHALNIKQLNAQHKELKALIQKLFVQKQTVKNIPQTKQSATDPAQLKKLNDLSWLIRKQGKALKTIQKTLSGKLERPSDNRKIQKTLTALKAELNTLNQQQNEIKQQLNTLQESVSIHLKKPVQKPPYSYKSTTDYKLD